MDIVINFSPNYVMPAGSKWKLDKIYKYYVATYSDFKEKGLKAKWKRITADYTFEKGYYTIKGINQAGDEIIIAPMIKVSNQKSMIDCKDIATEYGSYYYKNWYFHTYDRNDTYFSTYSMNELFNSRKDGAFKYKSDSNYLNMFNIFDLTNTVGADANSLVLGMYDLTFTTFAADTDLYNTPVTNVSIQYVKGEDIGKELPDGAYYKKLGADRTINEIHYAKYVEPNKQKASEYAYLNNVYGCPGKLEDIYFSVGYDISNKTYDWVRTWKNDETITLIDLVWASNKKDVKSYEIKDETLKNDKAVVSAIDNYIKYYNLWVKASDSNKQRYNDLMDTAYTKMRSIFNTRSSQYSKLSTEYSNLATEHEHDYYTIKVFYTLGTKRKSVTISNVRVGY